MSWLEPNAQERDLFDQLDLRSGLGRLCLIVASALRIEPLLLRNARTRFLPRSDASLENRFWFCPLIHSRSARAVFLRPGSARLLVDYLERHEPANAQRYRTFVNRHTQHWPLLERIEQRLRLTARNPAQNSAETEALLRRVVRHLHRLQKASEERRETQGENVETGAAAYDLARWIKDALPAIEPAIHRHPESDWLRQYAANLLGDTRGDLIQGTEIESALPAWIRVGLWQEETIKLRLRLYAGVLQCIEPDSKFGHALKLAYPVPAPIRLSFPDRPDEPPRWERLWPGRLLSVPDTGHIILQTLTGERYNLKTQREYQPTDKSTQKTGAERVVITYHVDDETTAQRIKSTLSQYNLEVELVSTVTSNEYINKSNEMAEQTDTHFLQLWTRNAAKDLWDPLQLADTQQPQRSLVVRLDQTPLPEGTAQAHIVDLIGWNGDPHAEQAQRLLQEIRSEYAPIGSEAVPEREHIEKVAKPEAGQLEQIELLLAAIDDPKTKPQRRLEIGDRLAELGDPRTGVGVRADGLPDIDWVEIPGGEFLYGENRAQRYLDAFWMARYPITNAQYQAFIDAGGYREERWWQVLAERIEAPYEPRRSQPNRPRERVSWYEAMAFCAWLSERLGTTIRLPTEQQWEKAARGSDGREYPWGDGYHSGYANINETWDKVGEHNVGQTTAVGLYPQGRSPYGILDLAGNVWEWCLNKYEKPDDTSPGGKDQRVLRGGSWGYYRDNARASYRYYRYGPDFRSNDIGFRVCCLSPID